ncbi:hypothetical protein CPM_1036 [Cuniculiplasma divulgatum]|uniref:Uncharacterized protein n=1 Tax=Cuniculiplasma divulgatum TaxID=1673428 RepID=A0A1R4A7B1_9ARCH|nr:hypothetical protein CPM_1036 [Cuniculiplasma divulgatum]
MFLINPLRFLRVPLWRFVSFGGDDLVLNWIFQISKFIFITESKIIFSNISFLYYYKCKKVYNIITDE